MISQHLSYNRYIQGHIIDASQQWVSLTTESRELFNNANTQCVENSLTHSSRVKCVETFLTRSSRDYILFKEQNFEKSFQRQQQL